MKIVEARRELASRLDSAGIPDAALEARILVEAASGDRHPDPFHILTPAMRGDLERFRHRRLSGEPVWRIVGEREFWGLPFCLSAATLEPRPDSETLVEAMIEALGDRRDTPFSILDLGTGTGCLVIALLSECRQATGLGIDLSEQACETARGNASRNGVESRASFRQGDWTKGLTERFDLVVSNPPYIPAGEIDGLSTEVRDHDPRLALDGGPDGLDAYRSLASGLPAVLAPGAIVGLEIEAGQGRDVEAIMAAQGFASRGGRHDLGGHLRALIFTWE